MELLGDKRYLSLSEHQLSKFIHSILYINLGGLVGNNGYLEAKSMMIKGVFKSDRTLNSKK